MQESTHPVLLYDGVCGLCNRLVQFTLRHDHKDTFRYASLQGPTAAQILARHGHSPTDLDTFYVVTDLDQPAEHLLSRSDAALFVLRDLGGRWRVLAAANRILPRFLRDTLYNVVARNRYRVFGKFNACPLPDPKDRHKFLDSRIQAAEQDFSPSHQVKSREKASEARMADKGILSTDSSIDSVLHEDRKFECPTTFAEKAHVKTLDEYEHLYKESVEQPEKFWGRVAEELHWFKKWDRVLEWNAPWAKWFSGGEVNLSYNCLDRHVKTWRKNKAALIWESEPGEIRTYTYQQLWKEVQKFANVLKGFGVKKGDRVAIYMGMTPELPIAMLACARIGAPHSIVFGGFASHALVDRIHDSQAVAVITQDGSYRRGSEVRLFPAVEEALKSCPSVKHVVVYRRTGTPLNLQTGRDHWWHELMAKASDECPAEPLDAEHPLYILYTSGTTGKPKGVVHTTGGYSVGTYLTTKLVFDLKEDDTYWCTADIGWVTGHSYIVYGPLQNGATSLMYEGAPNYPEPDRFWDIIDRHQVNVFYTAPTAIRTFIKWGDEWPNKHKMESLRLLGTVGEPINPEAWMWYREVIGHNRCPIVDTWWQTETGHIMIAPIPGAIATKPGSATRPMPGVVPEIVTMDGKPVPDGSGGFLIISKPWPGMLRTIYGDPDRYVRQYWSQISGVYFTGDGARKDKDGYFWIMGRVDDVLNVSGHRLSTMEVESALVAHDAVAEAAVVGRPDDLKGQAIAAFVTLEKGREPSPELKEELRKWVAKEIGALAKPDDIRFTDVLPKTRSGKIMRRLLRELATSGEVKGDMTTLEDFAVIAKLKESDEA